MKQKVFAGEFRPGDRLPSERELAEAMRVSRLSVREAYRSLQMYGMLETRRGKQGGAFICTPSNNRSLIQNISDLFRFQGITLEAWNEARRIFELDIAKLAIERATPKDFERLGKIIDEAVERDRSSQLAHREHIEFHLELARIARNPILLTSYQSMMDLLLNSFMALQVGADHYWYVAESHHKILEVMRTGNVDLFLKAIEEHVRRACENLVNLSKRFPLFSK